MPTLSFEPDSPYRRLAHSLDALPNRFPPAQDESDLRLLAKIFTPEEAGLAAGLLPELETPAQIAGRIGQDLRQVSGLLRDMARKGAIQMGKTPEGRLGFGLLPFVVGIYEAQGGRIDAELAQLFEDYFQSTFHHTIQLKPPVHRVIPVGASIENNMEVRPYESVTTLVDSMQAWGVTDCVCRTQKALIGQPCEHPVDVCMVLSPQAGAFDHHSVIRPLSHAGAVQTLQRAAAAGLVHCVSNSQNDLWYICNCCTCSCGILRGMAELGMANVVARSAFLNHVDEALCAACGDCVEACPFHALSIELGYAQVSELRCVGCGVCIPVCPQGALALQRRENEAPPPASEEDWRRARRAAAGEGG
jgi:electron transport complex protein RnfB